MNEKQKVARTLYLLEEAIFPVEEVEKFLENLPENPVKLFYALREKGFSVRKSAEISEILFAENFFPVSMGQEWEKICQDVRNFYLAGIPGTWKNILYQAISQTWGPEYSEQIKFHCPDF